MKAPVAKIAQCAIYTRKSTEHNLDLEFNSLDAQREACEAYIKSQAHEGWRLITDRFDDGAFSGASLERPALQRLLAEVQAEKIDTVVVYKVDRLTRSLGDFAKLVELFDRHGTSFVSVTQSFNTTTSMGRLTLNVLLSFAQFEREVIGERVRDKIAASKKKGLWVGGPVPLGYQCHDKKLLVAPEEAETVRTIFRLYLQASSIGDLLEQLDRRRIYTKVTVRSDGKTRGGVRFRVGALAYVLKNRIYVGEIAYRGEVYRGEHAPILERDLFDAVQAKLAANKVTRQIRLKGSSSILSGRIFDDRGNRMSSSHTNKRGARYRYYVSQAILQQRKAEAGRITRIPAPDIERLVLDALRPHLASSSEGPNAVSDRELIERYIERVQVKPGIVNVHLVPPAEAAQPDESGDNNSKQPKLPTTLTLPWTVPNFVAVKGILHTPSSNAVISSENRRALLAAIVKAKQWIDGIEHGHIASFAEIASREGQGERYIRLLSSLAFVSPRVIAAIANSTAPANLTVSRLAKGLPYSWAEQERRIGL